jgi:hypothetical protein
MRHCASLDTTDTSGQTRPAFVMRLKGKEMRKLAWLTTSLVASLVLAVGATAAPPEQTPWFPIDETEIIPAAPAGPCAYAIRVDVVGKARSTLFFDAAGNLVRLIDITPTLRVTFSANGKSISTVSPAVARVTFNADGSTVVTITGLQGHLIVGGGPPLAADAGRVVLFFSGPTDEEPDILFQAGPFNAGPFPQLCDVLAP